MEQFVPKRAGPRCFLVCCLTCILAPQAHFVVTVRNAPGRYWLKVVWHFNIITKITCYFVNIFYSCDEPTWDDNNWACDGHIQRGRGSWRGCFWHRRSQGSAALAPKSATRWAHRLCAVGCRRRNHKLLVAPATCLHLWARGQGKELNNAMPNMYGIHLHLKAPTFLWDYYGLLIFSETSRGAVGQLSYTPSLPSIKAVEPVKGCCVTSTSHSPGTWRDLSRQEVWVGKKVESQHSAQNSILRKSHKTFSILQVLYNLLRVLSQNISERKVNASGLIMLLEILLTWLRDATPNKEIGILATVLTI